MGGGTATALYARHLATPPLESAMGARQALPFLRDGKKTGAAGG
jgi:hypothetical protein